MAQASIPTTLALLLCDTVITDAASGKKTLVGLFDSMHPASVPFVYVRGFSVYARLSDAEGRYVFRVEIVYLDEDRRIGTAISQELVAPDRLGFLDLVLSLSVIPLEKYGKYEFQLYANDVFVGRTTMIVSPKKEK